MTVGAAIEAAARRLEARGVGSPRREAARLLALALGTDPGVLLSRRPEALGAHAAAAFEALVERRERREPFQYLEGKAEFRGREFLVDPRVLVPRPETELLVDAVLEARLREGARVLDAGTGSGCIAISLAHERPDLRVTALDLSPAALQVARANVERHGVGPRVEVVAGDLAEPPEAWHRRFDALVSNPPYVSEDEWAGLDPEVRDHEPKSALVPGPTGHEAYAALAASDVVAPGGVVAVELGWKSEAAVRAAFEGAGLRVERVLPDVQGIPRVLVARRAGP